MRFKSIKVKFIVIESIFLIAVIGGASLFYLLFAEDYYVYSERKKMNTAYQNLYEMNFEDITDENLQIINEYEDEGFRLIIATNMDDIINIIYSSIPKGSKKVIRNRLDMFSYVPDSVYTENRSIDLYGIIKQNEKEYYVYIYERTNQLKNGLLYSEKFLFFILIIALLIGGVLIFIIADKITKPIKKIDSIANKISHKDFSERIEEKENLYFDEIGSLSESINTMSEQIQKYMNDLENYNYILLQENYSMVELEERRRFFVNNISHDLKTPLAIISSQVEILMEMKDKVDKDYYFNSILEEIDKMGKMVGNMLEVSKLENELEHMDMERTNVTEITKKLIRKYNALFIQKQIRCKTDLEENCFAIANEMYLEKAINNYLLNAYEHTQKGKKIEVKLYTENNEVVLSVYNEGNKIDQTDIEKIWFSFYRQDKLNKWNSKQDNVGLGLYIVKSIIDLHNGLCGVDNKDKGVVFYIRLKNTI